MGFLSGLFGGGGDFGEIARPEYYEDKDYRYTQDYLKGFGVDLLGGRVPDYYKAIGETGSNEFESMLGLSTRDIMRSTEESLAKGGRARGGQLAASTAQAVGDTSIKARYEDYNRALVGKENLLKLGTSVTEGVRSSGQREGTYRNDFNWKDYDAQVSEREWQYQKEKEEDAALGEMIGTIASVGLGMATGGMSFGLQGALAGGADVLTGGGTSFLSSLGRIKATVPSSQSQILGFDTRMYS